MKNFFDIISGINNCLKANKFLYLDKVLKKKLFSILFAMILITWKFYFTFLFQASDLEIVFVFFI